MPAQSIGAASVLAMLSGMGKTLKDMTVQLPAPGKGDNTGIWAPTTYQYSWMRV